MASHVCLVFQKHYLITQSYARERKTCKNNSDISVFFYMSKKLIDFIPGLPHFKLECH
jgi:hypothetical protein